MKDGEDCSIRLVETQREGAVTLYGIQIRQGRELYRVAVRYSKLRSIAALLPETEEKFPPPRHVTRLLSVLTGDASYLVQRWQGMTRYFKAVSCHVGLHQSQGFRALLAMAEIQIQQEVALPAAPKPSGRKLLPKQLDGKLLVIAS